MQDAVSKLIGGLEAEIPGLMIRERIPGMSLAIIVDGAISWVRGFGITDRLRRLPITPDTMFSLQSGSKTFTATAVMLAVQEALIDLDLPVVAYLPDFTVSSRFDEHPERIITMRHLLSHRAGFTHEAPVGSNYERDTAGSSFEAHIASIGRTWLRFPVGQRYAYSNLGVDLAGYILQTVSGMPFAEYVKERLFGPLEHDPEFVRL
jgi:CubicO group peptidase (beta-lactamase class C family)